MEGQSNQHVEHSVIACNWLNESRSVCSHPEPKWGVLVHCRNIQFDLHWQFDWLLPLQQRAVRLPGWARAAPPSGYHSVLLHAVELVHSEHTYTTIVRRWFIVHVVESSWSRGDVESIVKATPTMTAEAILMCATSILVSLRRTNMHYLSSSIRLSVLLQQQVGHLDFPIFCCDVQRSEALLRKHKGTLHLI